MTIMLTGAGAGLGAGIVFAAVIIAAVIYAVHRYGHTLLNENHSN